MSNLKLCTHCDISKEDKDFYLCSGKRRSECKMCTIKKNIDYQRKTRAWKHRHGKDDTRKLYMRTYYAKNKEKFAQYRAEFRLRYPEYHREYFKKRKEG